MVRQPTFGEDITAAIAGRDGEMEVRMNMMVILRDKMNCGVGWVNCFLGVILVCLGSRAQGRRAGTLEKLW